MESPLRGSALRLMELAADYRDCFRNGRRSVAETARRYLSGLLNQAPRKNMERMEEYVEGSRYESTQYFLSESPWDHRKVLDRSAADVSRLFGARDTALIIDESGLAKKGIMSVGVARQYNGRLGKVDNCQVGVFAALSNGRHAALVDARLYLPKEWTDDPARCQHAKIPAEECVPRSKLLLASEMILRAKELRLGFSWICVDAFYGSSNALLRQISDWGLHFVADVRANQSVCCDAAAPMQKQRIDELFFGDVENVWEEVKLECADGIKRLNACRKRVIFPHAESETPRKGWAVCVTDAVTGACTYFLSNCEVTLAELVRRQARRYWIERAFQDSKSSLGMADYQARGWVAWHHHMALVALAQRFVLAEQTQSCRELAMLTAQDIIQALTVLIPRKDTTVEEVIGIIERRHKKRQSVRNSKLKRRSRCILQI